MIGEPPFEPGAVQVTVAEESPAVAVPIVGAPGLVGADCWLAAPGVPAGDCESAQLAPTLLSEAGSSSSSDWPVVDWGQPAPP